MVDHEQVQRKLTEKFLEAQVRNPSYSLRAFAKKLSLSSGALSDILSGKRKTSVRLARRVAERAGLAPDEISKLFFSDHSSKEASEERLSYSVLAAQEFKCISEWYHFAILSLMKTKDFRSEPRWIGDRLGITEREAAAAIGRLIRLGIVKRVGRSLRRTNERHSTSDGVRSLALTKAHLTNLELARRSLEEDDISTRDFSALTLTLSPEQLPFARKRIRQFQDELSSLVEKPQNTEVYKLSMQLIPLTGRKKI